MRGPGVEDDTVDESEARAQVDVASDGELEGRVLQAALADGPPSVSFQRLTPISGGGVNGEKTVLMYQHLVKQVHFDQACFKNIVAAKGHNKYPLRGVNRSCSLLYIIPMSGPSIRLMESVEDVCLPAHDWRRIQ